MRSLRVILVAVLGAALSMSSSQAQVAGPGDPPRLVIEDTVVRELVSDSTGVNYKLYIRLPKGYGSDRRFPVVYLLDADYSFLLARNITEHLGDRDHLRELILVGVAYAGPLRYRTNRTRDYTPTHVPTGGYGAEHQKYSGGGPKFRDFLERELIPWIDNQYRADVGDRTFVGHSFGGLFGSWVMVTRPALFQRYILVSPSLWYDEHFIFGVEKKYAAEHRRLNAKVYFCVGSEEMRGRQDMVGDLKKFVGQLQQRKYLGLDFRHRVWQGETHNSIFPLCLSSGLRFVHEGR